MTSIPSSSSLSSSCLASTSTSSRTNPEVFLSFSCSDTCKGYTDGLYTRLIDAGINVLRDNDDLHPKIRDALLLDSIKQSKILIPVISKDYAACQSCLMGLAQMLECEKANNQLIVPIFYDIDPADLKCQRGCVGESFSKHEDRGVDCEDIAKWKQALQEIVERKVYDLPNTNDGHQSDHIKTVVSNILQLLKKNDLVVIDRGIDPHVQEVTRKLGVIRNLRVTPDFRTPMPLERLVLERCPLLSQISQSSGNLENLVSLNLKFCRLFKDLPEELCYMRALEELLIDGTSIRIIHFRQASMQRLKILSACQCESLVWISDSIGHLKSLLYLGLDGSAIDILPDSIGSLKKLQELLLGNCRKLAELPYAIGNLESLEVLDLSSTTIARLPKSFKGLQKLKVLKTENTHLREFPKDIEDLKMLEEMDLSQCKNLKGPIRCHFNRLSSLKIFRLSFTKTSGLPWSDDRFSAQQTLKSLPNLQQLDLSDCDQVRVLPILPSTLSSLRWGSKKMRTVPDLSYLPNLKELHLGDGTDPGRKSSSEPPQIGWVTSLVNLEILELCHSKITALPENFSALQLRKLILHYANSLDLRELPSSLSTLCLQYCTIRVPQFSKMRCLSELELKHCDLAKIDGLEDLKLLRLLHISHCSVQTLDGLESMPRLRKLTLFNCPSLTELPDPAKYRFEIDMCNP